MQVACETAVAIAGAGPAGLTVARLLARAGMTVAVISPPMGTNRLEMLAPSSMGILVALELTEIVRDPEVSRPCAGIRRRWVSRSIDYDDFLRRPGGEGFIVDRRLFDRRLRELCVSAGARMIAGRVTAVRRTRTGFVLEIAGEESDVTLATENVVDATGRSSALARRLGATRRLFERLVAERCGTEAGREASQEPVWLDVDVVETGWKYAVAGPDGRSESWAVHRQARRSGNSGALVNASSVTLSHAAGAGWIAVGDAAAAFDPITSQGLANALSSALVAAGAIVSAGGVSDASAVNYSDIISNTFSYSEVGRAAVYCDMRAL